jgi:hypothetical protein
LPNDADRLLRLRGLFAPDAGSPASSLRSLVAFNGCVQQVHLHISEAALGPTAQGVPDDDRSRRLRGIRARLRSVLNGERKMAAYLRREFGKAEVEDLFGADLERLYAWVHSLPRGAEYEP